MKTIRFSHPFATLTRGEWALWLGSLLLIAGAMLLTPAFDGAVLCALLIGATALIFVSKGEPLGQLLTVMFALIYAYLSFRQRYWGEMITYLGMTAPMALAALISWVKHPYAKGKSEVKIAALRPRVSGLVLVLTVAVTGLFYFILRAFHTPNLFWSTASIATSFSASALTFLRSPYYALAYAGNDLVLILLWLLAAKRDIACLPMVLCFVIFLVNDCYGFVNWRRMQKRQHRMRK